MAGKDLGNKHNCWKCGTKFYDLRKPAPICPKCGADARESPALKAPPGKKGRAAPRPVPAVEPELPDVELDKDAEEEAFDEEVEDADDEA